MHRETYHQNSLKYNNQYVNYKKIKNKIIFRKARKSLSQYEHTMLHPGSMYYVEGDRQNLRQLNCSFTTISSHFSVIYIIIFHKTEVQMVILSAEWVYIYDWFKSYDKKHKYFPFCFFLLIL